MGPPEGVRFEPADAAVAATVVLWFTTPADLLRWTGLRFTHPLDPQRLAAHITDVATSAQHAAVAGRAGREVVCYGELADIDVRRGAARLARVAVAPQWRGRGIGGALVGELLRLGFAKLGLGRLELNVIADNAEAVGAYRRAGFCEDDRDHRTLVAPDGPSLDLIRMSLSANQWVP